ncbi:MAG TPA: hypothetical protein VFX20_13950 [Steroidobacteraceae bacterium]|nr:hypothetical protein [Steroidobacteraceae bacterium]
MFIKPIRETARELRKEEADRLRLYQRLSPIVGAFDASEMTSADIAVHGLKKLNLRVPPDKDDQVSAMNSWLDGRDSAANPGGDRRHAMDSRGRRSAVAEYLKE